MPAMDLCEAFFKRAIANYWLYSKGVKNPDKCKYYLVKDFLGSGKQPKSFQYTCNPNGLTISYKICTNRQNLFVKL